MQLALALKDSHNVRHSGVALLSSWLAAVMQQIGRACVCLLSVRICSHPDLSRYIGTSIMAVQYLVAVVGYSTIMAIDVGIEVEAVVASQTAVARTADFSDFSRSLHSASMLVICTFSNACFSCLCLQHPNSFSCLVAWKYSECFLFH